MAIVQAMTFESYLNGGLYVNFLKFCKLRVLILGNIITSDFGEMEALLFKQLFQK